MIFGIGMIILGMILCILAAAKGESGGGSRGGGSHGSGNCDCCCICLGGPAYSDPNYSSKKTGCDFPSETVIYCSDCQQTVERHKNMNGLGLAVCLGTFGVIFVGIALIILITN